MDKLQAAIKKFKIYRDKATKGWRDDLRWCLLYPNGDLLCNSSFEYVLEEFKKAVMESR